MNFRISLVASFIIGFFSLIGAQPKVNFEVGQNKYDSLIKINLLPIITLGIAQATAAYFDGYTTMYENGKIDKFGIKVCEQDPVAKFFIGKYPTWNRMIVWGSVEIICATYLAYTMKNSNNMIIKKLWWIPQACFISFHGGCIALNIHHNQEWSRVPPKRPVLK
jgi:hypothetical protein